MKIRYYSDLHLEFYRENEIDFIINKIPNGKDEICILAGDIGNPYEENYKKFMYFIENNFKKSFIIAGNHEYYNLYKSIEEINIYLENFFTKYSNITFLNNNYEYYEDYCFIGTTLWSKIINPNIQINDLHFIYNFDYLQYNRLNMIAVDFLEDAINNNNNCIIITHHLPTNNLINEKFKTYKYRPYNQFFYTNLEELIEKYNNKIKCWIYGHTHIKSIKKINNISFLCNPIGYKNENINPWSYKLFML